MMYADDGGLLAVQQQRRVAGTVKDDKGDPVIGANIVVKRATGSGTITDIDGRLSINASSGATLTVSCIGFRTQEVAVGNQSELKIVIREDAEQLGKVVVVGYGTNSRRNLITSVSTVDANKMSTAPVANITDVLAGRTAGLIVTQSGGGIGKASGISIRWTSKEIEKFHAFCVIV
jgi:hypothetical protein